MPSPGKIEKLRVPAGPGVRDDGGVYEGGEVSIHYDPMISKFAVHGKDRKEAIERMRRALAEYQVVGIKTTLPFFRDVMNDPVFVAGDLDTGFISAFRERQKEQENSTDPEHLAIIAAVLGRKDADNNKVGVRPAPNLPSRWVMAARPQTGSK
jgi:acetyl-CoA carboxylase, biotin carboxylase subunit